MTYAWVQTLDSRTNDPLDWEPATVYVPDGWYRVFSGALKPGDRVLNLLLLRDGIESWDEVDLERMNELARTARIRQSATLPLCVIRRGTQVDQHCERCGMFKRHRGERYCDYCREIIRRAIREQG